MFKTNEQSITEGECVNVLGKFMLRLGDRIIEQSNLENLTFEDVLRCMRRREQEDNYYIYKMLIGIRSQWPKKQPVNHLSPENGVKTTKMVGEAKVHGT